MFCTFCDRRLNATTAVSWRGRSQCVFCRQTLFILPGATTRGHLGLVLAFAEGGRSVVCAPDFAQTIWSHDQSAFCILSLNRVNAMSPDVFISGIEIDINFDERARNVASCLELLWRRPQVLLNLSQYGAWDVVKTDDIWWCGVQEPDDPPEFDHLNGHPSHGFIMAVEDAELHGLSHQHSLEDRLRHWKRRHEWLTDLAFAGARQEARLAAMLPVGRRLRRFSASGDWVDDAVLAMMPNLCCVNLFSCLYVRDLSALPLRSLRVAHCHSALLLPRTLTLLWVQASKLDLTQLARLTHLQELRLFDMPLNLSPLGLRPLRRHPAGRATWWRARTLRRKDTPRHATRLVDVISAIWFPLDLFTCKDGAALARVCVDYASVVDGSCMLTRLSLEPFAPFDCVRWASEPAAGYDSGDVRQLCPTRRRHRAAPLALQYVAGLRSLSLGNGLLTLGHTKYLDSLTHYSGACQDWEIIKGLQLISLEAVGGKFNLDTLVALPQLRHLCLKDVQVEGDPSAAIKQLQTLIIG